MGAGPVAGTAVTTVGVGMGATGESSDADFRKAKPTAGS
jgi:hypothetical protein